MLCIIINNIILLLKKNPFHSLKPQGQSRQVSLTYAIKKLILLSWLTANKGVDWNELLTPTLNRPRCAPFPATVKIAEKRSDLIKTETQSFLSTTDRHRTVVRDCALSTIFHTSNSSAPPNPQRWQDSLLSTWWWWCGISFTLVVIRMAMRQI